MVIIYIIAILEPNIGKYTLNINGLSKLTRNTRIFNQILICLACVFLSTYSAANDNSLDTLPDLAMSLNARAPLLLESGNILEQATYEPATKLFSRYIKQPQLDFSTISVEEAKRIHKGKLQTLLPFCNGTNKDLIYNQRVTFRYYFKDKLDILTSMIDISRLTCEALNQ